jgi:gamma-glutamylcyclotransferase (GGCT)/AIG2-like uncharacterized protein YtfP
MTISGTQERPDGQVVVQGMTIMANRYYFAYGPNLNSRDWRTWCRDNEFPPDLLRFRNIAYLPDWELTFDYRSTSRRGGVLDLQRRVGQLVAGVVFEVAPGGWEALDKKEGAPNCYQRQSSIALTPAGETIPVTTYVVRSERREDFVAPTPQYVEVVRRGLVEHGLSERSLEAAVRGELVPWEVDGLFVYGTLLRGEPRFPLLEPFALECILLAATPGRLADLVAFPGMLMADGDGDFVRGEFLRLRDIGGALRCLDRIEGFNGFGRTGSFYHRDLIEVDVGDGRIRSAWTYRLKEQPDNARLIPCGDWREHQGRRESFLTRLVAAHTAGEEPRLALSLAQRIPFAFGGDLESVARDLQPLSRAVLAGVGSERRLAQESGQWVAIP